jgi:hypothetical protein
MIGDRVSDGREKERGKGVCRRDGRIGEREGKGKRGKRGKKKNFNEQKRRFSVLLPFLPALLLNLKLESE